MTERTLFKAWQALGSVAKDLVVVGGTAHRLFLRHPLARDPRFTPLTTEDIDIAAPLSLGHAGSNGLLDQLLAAGFEPKVRGAVYATTIYVSAESSEPYLQFLAPQTGSGTKRGGARDNEMVVHGVCMEKLPSIDVLLRRPWRLRIQAENLEADIAVVHPADFVLQKLLIHEKRTANKRAKDLMYVHDTLMILALLNV